MQDEIHAQDKIGRETAGKGVTHGAEEKKGLSPRKQSSYNKFLQTARSGIIGDEARRENNPFYEELKR